MAKSYLIGNGIEHNRPDQLKPNTQNQITIKRVKPEQEITLVSKGIRESIGHTYIDHYALGQTFFLKVTRTGRKYIHGFNIYYEEGKQIERNWENEWNSEKYMIFAGIRHDLKKAYDHWRQIESTYEDEYREAQRQASIKAHELERQLLDQWEQQKPRPNNPFSNGDD